MLADRRAMLQQQREDIDAVLAEIAVHRARLPAAAQADERRRPAGKAVARSRLRRLATVLN